MALKTDFWVKIRPPGYSHTCQHLKTILSAYSWKQREQLLIFFFSSCFFHYHDHPSSALTTHKEWGKKLSGSCDSINSIQFLSRIQYSPFDIIYNASFLKHQGFTGTELKSSNADQAPFYAPFYWSSCTPFLHQPYKKPYYNRTIQYSSLRGHLFSLSMQAKKPLLCFLLILCPVWHGALPFFHEDSVVAGYGPTGEIMRPGLSSLRAAVSSGRWFQVELEP